MQSQNGERGIYFAMVRYQLRLLVQAPGFFGVVCFYLLCGLLSFFAQCAASWGAELSTVRDASDLVLFSGLSHWAFLQPLQPFLWVLPFATTFLQEQRCGSKALLILRGSCKGYYRAKGTAAAIGGFLAVFCPLLCNFLLCFLFFPQSHNSLLGIYGMPSYQQAWTGTNLLYCTAVPQQPFLALYLQSPLLYDLLHLLLLSGLSALMGFWIMGIAYFVRKHLVLLFLPGFLLLQALSIATELSFHAAMQDTAVTFLNCDLLDYCVPFSSPGKDPRFFCAVVLLLVLSGVALQELAIWSEGREGGRG